MYKLLNAGFYKLIKNKVFWIMMFATVIMVLSLPFVGNEFVTIIDKSKGTEEVLIMNMNVIPFIIAIFITIFTSTDFSERNHKK